MEQPDLARHDTLPKLLVSQAGSRPREVAQREKDLGIWRTYSWSDYLDEVKAIAGGLKALGLGRGEVLAIIGRSRPNWVWSELAGQALGAARDRRLLDVPVATYLTDASVHPLWVHPAVDLHLAIHDLAAELIWRLAASQPGATYQTSRGRVAQHMGPSF